MRVTHTGCLLEEEAGESGESHFPKKWFLAPHLKRSLTHWFSLCHPGFGYEIVICGAYEFLN